MKGTPTPSVEELLAEAASQVVEAPNLQPWNYGWFVADYRRSASAALSGRRGAVTIATEGRSAYEQAVDLLRKERAVRERWQEEELWGVVASVVVAASETRDAAASLAAGIAHIRSAGTTLVLMPLANVASTRPPVAVADCVIGNADEALLGAIETAANDRPSATRRHLDRLAASYGATDAAVVVAATWSQGQSGLAVSHAEDRLRAILDVALLLESAPDELELYSLRGSTNRPGVRGVTIHRPALEEAMAQAGASAELAAEIPIISQDAARAHVHWHSADPVPLSRMLGNDRQRSWVDRCVRRSSPVARRIRLAARWYAEAHWSSDKDDAMLALGIALDALIGARSGLPGRVMRERFALLEAEPVKRRDRAARYAEVFSARSAVAHAGASSSVEAPGFVRGVAKDVVWAAYRMLAFEDRFAPESDADMDAWFEQLRWGTATWD